MILATLTTVSSLVTVAALLIPATYAVQRYRQRPLRLLERSESGRVLAVRRS